MGAQSDLALPSPLRVNTPAAIEYVSIIVPMRNEAAHVEQLIADIAAQDFADKLEVFVADGRSTDDSGLRATSAGKRWGINLTVLDNPGERTTTGLNACIRRARGELIVRMDCHARYPSDYVRRCAVVSEETGAWNVGGPTLASGTTATERAAACAMESPFGGIGWTRGVRDTRTEVDTVYCGAFRPEAFARAGLFDESLRCNEDEELNLRLRRAGGRIVLDSSIRATYTPRGTVRAIFRQYYRYGLWKVAVIRKHRRSFGVRSVVPLIFVASLLGLSIAALLQVPAALLLLAAEFLAYAVLALAFGARSVRRRREPPSLIPRVLAVFLSFHLAYGLGFLDGFARALVRWLRPMDAA